MHDITKSLRAKKNNAKRVITNTIENTQDRDMLLKVIDTAFSDILSGSTVFLSKKNETADVLDKQSILGATEALTGILTNFYEVENYLDFKKSLDQNRIVSGSRTNTENVMESYAAPMDSAVPPAVMEAGGDNKLQQVLKEQLPLLTDKMNELAEALTNFEPGGGGEIDIPFLGKNKPGAGRRGVRPRLPGGRGPSGPVPKSPYTLGGIAGAAAMGYLAFKAFTGGFGRASGEPGIDGIVAGGASGQPLGYTVGPGAYQAADVSKATGDWKNDKPFLTAVDNLARKWNVDANDLLGLMQSESGIDPTRVGSNGATGLIQWIPKYAKAVTGYSTDQIRKLSRAQQVALIDKTLTAAQMPKGANAGQIYAAVFLPSIARRAGWKGVLTRKSDPDSFYEQNEGLDVIAPYDQITIEDLAVRVNNKRKEAGLPQMGNLQRVGEAGPIDSKGWTGPLGKSSYSGGENYNVYRSYYNNGRGGFHPGIDMAVKAGTPIYAAAAGKVILAGTVGAYGNAIYIDHGNNIQTRYGHALDGSLQVRAGQQVSAGQFIAKVGSTGRSTGAHLHFEVRRGESSSTSNKDTVSIDPRPFIKGSKGPVIDQASRSRPKVTPAVMQKYNRAQEAIAKGQFPGFPYAMPSQKNSGSSRSNPSPARQYQRHFGL